MAPKLRIAAGYFFIVLGIIGLILPVVPQVPFFLAAAALLGKDHHLVRRARAWLKKRGITWGKDETEEAPTQPSPESPATGQK